MAGVLKAILLIIAASVASASAQAPTPPILSQPDPDSPIGARNQKAPEGLAQYDFVIGDWNADVTFFRPQGEPLRYKAKWHNIWIVNGNVVFQEWRGPYTTGGELRYYSAQENNWSGRNVYPGNGWYETISTWNEDTGEMTVRREMTGPRGAHLNEEIYFDISADSFKIRTRKSFDQGETWEAGNYEMTATRSNASD